MPSKRGGGRGGRGGGNRPQSHRAAAAKPPAKKAAAAAAAPTIAGRSTSGESYANADAMWQQRLQGDLYDRETGWYGKSLAYWEAQPTTINGVLGGMEHVHDADIRESRTFIEGLPDHGRTRALDCAAGIGRITKALLAPLYARVDVLEPVEAMLAKAREELAGVPAVDHYYLCSMEKHVPEERYDLVVIQWAAIYLTDADFVKVFGQYGASLTPQGYLFFKENCGAGGRSTDFLVDDADSSLTRSDVHYKRLFEEAGLKVVREAYQKEWPPGLMPVKMYALKAKGTANNSTKKEEKVAAAAPEGEAKGGDQ